MGSLDRSMLGPILSAACCLVAAGCFHRSASPPVLIGHVVPLSGPDKTAGEHSQRGILLAVEEVNEEGNLIEGRRLAVHHADTHSERADIRAVAVRLARVNHVAALLFGSDADQVGDLGTVGREYEIPLVVPEGPPDQSAGDWVFYSGVAPVERGKALARFAAREPLKATRAVVLTAAGPDRGAADAAVAAGFIKEFRKRGGTIVAQPSYKDVAGLKEAIKQVARPLPHALVLSGSVGDLSELREAKLDARVPVLFGAEEVGLENDQAGLPAQTVYAATAFPLDAGTAPAKEFARKYKERFGEDPDGHAVLAHDEARLLFEAMRRAKSFEGAKVRDSLAGLADFQSLTGPLSFQDHRAFRTVFIVRWKNGRSRTVAHFPLAGG